MLERPWIQRLFYDENGVYEEQEDGKLVRIGGLAMLRALSPLERQRDRPTA